MKPTVLCSLIIILMCRGASSLVRICKCNYNCPTSEDDTCKSNSGWCYNATTRTGETSYGCWSDSLLSISLDNGCMTEDGTMTCYCYSDDECNSNEVTFKNDTHSFHSSTIIVILSTFVPFFSMVTQ